jgi:hypothetical protein
VWSFTCGILCMLFGKNTKFMKVKAFGTYSYQYDLLNWNRRLDCKLKFIISSSRICNEFFLWICICLWFETLLCYKWLWMWLFVNFPSISGKYPRSAFILAFRTFSCHSLSLDFIRLRLKPSIWNNLRINPLSKIVLTIIFSLLGFWLVCRLGFRTV